VAGIVAGEDYAPATLAQAGGAVWELFTGTLGVVVRLPQAVWDVAVSTATGAPRDPAGVMSVVGVGRLAGEITATGAAGTGAAAGGWRQTASALASLLASLNMALFVFNLIPLPPLDGGHVAGAVHEGARRTWARLRGRPDPGPVDTARLMPLSYAVAAALMAMTVLLIVADVIDPLTLT
jgi:Zn-dependent protease